MTNEAFTPAPGVRRRLVPSLAAVTVLAVLLGGGYALRRASNDSAGSGGAPAVLRLTDYQVAAAAADKNVDGTFRLAGALPAGPSSAAVRWLTVPSRTDIDRLARALGIRAHLSRADGATTYTSGTGVLRVQQGPGGSWQYARAMAMGGGCPPIPGPTADDPALTVTCDVGVPVPLGSSLGTDSSTSSGPASTAGSVGSAISEPPVTATKPSVTPAEPPPTSPPVGTPKKLVVTTPDQARAAARPVLEAVGIDPADAAVHPGQPQAVVTADPTVDGLATYGLTTSVTVFGRRVDSAGGWLGASARGATYPVISARAAWKQLGNGAMPRPLIACPQPLPVDSDPLICGGAVTVTGARFGLSLHQEGSRQVLVPSWLFDVRGSDNPIPVVAVDPRYLAGPPVPTSGGDKPGSSGSGSSGGGSSGSTGTGGTVVPPISSSSPGPATPESRFSAVKADGARALVVSFTGGVDTCYAYDVVATETERQVSLALAEKTTSSDKPCIDLAQVYERRVALSRPLGTRQVVDDVTGAVLLAPAR